MCHCFASLGSAQSLRSFLVRAMDVEDVSDDKELRPDPASSQDDAGGGYRMWLVEKTRRKHSRDTDLTP